MTKIEIIGNETDDELTMMVLNAISELFADTVGEIIEMVRSTPGGLKEFVETQLKAQEQGPGAMKAHLIYYALSILPEHDQSCLLVQLFQNANFEEIKDKTPVIWLPPKGIMKH